ncbi:MAG TPA: hypothetical protein VFT64_09995 [Rickettsiales bacterium]|nr:hypothetical protein [Rickettsiales bacterium]
MDYGTATAELPSSYAGDYWGEVPAANHVAASNELFEDLVRQLRTDKAFMDTVNGILAMEHIAGVPTGNDNNHHSDTRNSANNSNRKNDSESNTGRLIRDASVARLAAQQRELEKKQRLFEEQRKTARDAEKASQATPEPQQVIEYEQRIIFIDDERVKDALQPLQGVFAELASRLHGIEPAVDVSSHELAVPTETPKVGVICLTPKTVSRQVQTRRAA